MRIVLQKVSEGSVDVVDETSGEVDTTFEPQHIGIGYVLLVGVEDTDGAKQIDWLARKIANLRVFEDENGKMNRSIHDVNGSVLSISQFTLYADVRKGNRPNFVKAGAPAHAEQTWHGFNDALRSQGLEVKKDDSAPTCACVSPTTVRSPSSLTPTNSASDPEPNVKPYIRRLS